MKTKAFFNFFQLSLMLFLQFMLFAVWWVPLAAYLTNIGVEGTQKALILSSMAIVCMASPLVGNFVNGELIQMFTETSNGASIVNWSKVWGITSIITLVVLFLFALFFRNSVIEKKEEAK